MTPPIIRGMMTMPRRKKQRWLPENVTEWRDRHGKKRYRYRRTGQPSHNFRSDPGTPEFIAELAEAKGAGFARQFEPFSMDELAHKLFASRKWLGMKDSSQYTYRRIIQRYLEMKDKKGRRYGSYNAKLATASGLDKQLSQFLDKPGAGTTLRKALAKLFKYAIKLNWIAVNPVAETEPFATNKEGWHTWTDDEIERYRAYWPLGTMARLTLEIALDTAGRRCELNELERAQLVEGRWEIAHAKDNEETSVRISSEAKAAIDALPVAPIRYFIVSAWGKPYSVEGLSNRFRKWAREAGCPTNIHGLRKARSRLLAESGATAMEGRSVTGHKKDGTFLHYAAKADRKRMADAATAKAIGKPRLANPEEKL